MGILEGDDIVYVGIRKGMRGHLLRLRIKLMDRVLTIEHSSTIKTDQFGQGTKPKFITIFYMLDKFFVNMS